MDFALYRSNLKNQAVVDEIEQKVKAFKPKTYDVSSQIKAIESYEAQALKTAHETKGAVDKELVDLEKTLKNIEDARPFEDLTVVRHNSSKPRSRIAADPLTRMRSPRQRQILTGEPSSSSQTIAGTFRDTRYDSSSGLEELPSDHYQRKNSGTSLSCESLFFCPFPVYSL